MRPHERPFSLVGMQHEPLLAADERLNEVCDRDELWGPLVWLRPEKNRCFSALRVLAIGALLGLSYGMLLEIGIVSLCRILGQHLPSLASMPLLFTGIFFFGFQLTLGPAWNRRARLMVRRADYLHSIGRQSEQL